MMMMSFVVLSETKPSLPLYTCLGLVLSTTMGGCADEAQRLLDDINKANRSAPNEDHEDGVQENDQEIDRDETDPYNEVTFGRRRPNSVVVDWTNKVLFVLEFKHTSDQKPDYRERGQSRARAQHDILKP